VTDAPGPAHGDPYRPPPDAGLALVHADADLLVLAKPAGLLCAPGRGDDKQDCLLARLRRRHPEALLVHRLDMDTSGLMVFARHAAAHAALSEAFRARRVDKGYEARVHGTPEASEGEIALPLAADWPNRPRQVVDALRGRPALTRWRLLQAGAESRLALAPVTGRSHQLRVHLAAIGHPIVGDPLYGRRDRDAGVPRMMLHACRLAFPHPADGRPLAFAHPVPF